MIKRYTLPGMAKIWTDENRFTKMLEVEILACEALARQKIIPPADLARIRKRAKFSVKRIDQIEKKTKHDVIAFLTNIAENVGPSSRYIHQGLTSSDVLDTALSVQMREAIDILIADVKKLIKALAKKARQYKQTPMIGRSHGIHAEPITFGLKMALFYTEMQRNLNRLREAREEISYGKISGAVGTFAHLDPKVEAYVCRKLKLKPAPVSTQVLQRDRHAYYLNAIALTGAGLEKLATEIRGLQRTEILEAEEFFSKGQKGSSAMPHKRNPITCERITGLARILRTNALAAVENISLWHERDISHSSVERVIIPDSTILLDYMLDKMTRLIENLLVYPLNMKKNMAKTKGLIFSQAVMLKLTQKGITREKAYEIIQRNAMRVWKENIDFKQLLKQDKDLAKYLKPKEIEQAFDLKHHLRNVDKILKRTGII